MTDPVSSSAAPFAAARRRLADALSAGTLRLPPMPIVATEIIAGSLADDADAARLAELIQGDQALASHVLRIVNSPSLRAATEIVSLRQAIGRLGMNRIREIAIAAALTTSLYAAPTYAHEIARASSLALCTALWSKEIARACRKNTETAYLCGLLHDVGTPVVLGAIDSGARLATCDVTALLAEFAIPAGELLARTWRLPSVVATTIRCANNFRAAREHADTVAVVRCGTLMAGAMLDQALDADALVGLDAAVHLNLYPEDVERLCNARASIGAALQSVLR